MDVKQQWRVFWSACRAARYDVSGGRSPYAEWAEAELERRAFPKADRRPGRILRLQESRRRERVWREARACQAAKNWDDQLAMYDVPCP